MLFNDTVLNNLPIGSVRSSGRICTVTGIVIKPNNLHIDEFRCRIVGGRQQLLSPLDIRDLSPQGIVINDHDILLDEVDAIRLKPVLTLNYQLVGKSAFVGKRKIGRVEGYAIDLESLFIQKIYVRPGLLSRMNSDRLVFDRSAIKEVTDTKVVFVGSNIIRDTVKASIPTINSLMMPQSSASATLTAENE